MSKLSVSNIAWISKDDEEIYRFMHEKGYAGLEIAPTRILGSNPYDRIDEAKAWAKKLKSEEGFVVSSMQSIWYGRNENIFDSETERLALIEYTKKAINFAEAIGCGNLVFGCPKNRNINEGKSSKVAVEFFKELGDYAYAHNTVLAMEANPVIYNTNFCNTTTEAIELIKEVGSKGFKLNLDFGTIIYNKENIEYFENNIGLINHIHISEPGLATIERRESHKKLAEVLKKNNYVGFVSLETKTNENKDEIKDMIAYLKDIFG